MGQKPQQCFMTPLLVGTDGSKKMSKSLGNYIGVAEPPEQIFGKVMSITDDLIMNYFELLTDVPDKELREFQEALDNNGVNPMELKKRLAKEIIVQLYDNRSAIEAEEHFSRTIQNKELPEDIPERKVAGMALDKALVDGGLASSRSEARRLITQGAVSIDGEKATDVNRVVGAGSIIRAGKRRYLKSV
jgi:tyrosyl-tRNA synthetase